MIDHDTTLTRREREVLILLSTGHSDREMAQVLFISSKTVEKHVAQVRRKLCAPSRAAAVTNAYRLGLL